MSDRMSEEEIGENHRRGLPKVEMEALFGHFSRMLRVELAPLHERMDRLEENANGDRTRGRNRDMGREHVEDGFEEEEVYESHSDNFERNRRGGRNMGGVEEVR